MKKNRLIIFALIAATALLLSFSVLADTPGNFKTVSSYDKDASSLKLDFYITKGSAIAGYCSFKYDTDTLTLLDGNSNALPDPIPEFLSDQTTTYLRNVIVPHGDVVITNVGRNASQLINVQNGFLFFAWTIPSNIEPAVATDNSILIASAYFDVKENATPDVSSITVASSEYTDTVEKWYPGIIVIDKDKQSYMFDGKEAGKQYYSAGFEVSGENKEQDVPSQNEGTEGETAEPSEDVDVDTDKPEDKNTGNESDKSEITQEPEDTEKSDEADNDSKINDDKQEPEEKEESSSSCPESGTNENTALTVTQKEDFGLSVEAETDKARIKWVQPDSIEGLDNYNIILCDNEYHVIKKITGIFPVSTSYTVEDLCGNTTYKVYLTASKGSDAYSSHVYTFTTKSYEGFPPVISHRITYDKKGAYLFGLAGEDVLYGQTPLKAPVAISKEGLAFMGWSRDGVNVIDIDKEKIYENTIFYPVFAENDYSNFTGYITGYNDGTFKPEGSITRAEAATLISRISDKYDENGRYCHTFTDCKNGIWYEKAVAFCSSNKYINGYSDGTFKPDGKITRAEFSAILVRVFGFENTLGTNVFSDIDNHWAKNYISVLYGAKVIVPNADGSFIPNDYLTREDAVTMINRCLRIIPDRKAVLDSVKANGYIFSDVPQYSESFYDIMTAVKK